MKVLQVEDDQAAAQTVELMLKSQGHTCETTASGEAAIDLAQKKDYDIILLDIMLPDIDGYEVLKRLQAAEVQTPVLIQTGLLSREAGNGSSLGSENYLIKPFGKAEIIKKMEALADGSSPTQTAASPVVEEDPDRREGQRDEAANRRAVKRFKTLKSGQLIYKFMESDIALCTMDCLILNLSAGGAALQPADIYKGPDTFTLQIKLGTKHLCQVCWKHRDKVGVRFVDEAESTPAS